MKSPQFSSVAQLCPTLCYPMDCSKPGFLVHHQLLELTQTHVHGGSDAIQPSHPLSSPSPPAFNLSQHQGIFQWVSSLNQVAKVLEFQLQHQFSSVQLLSRVQLFVTSWTAAHQASLSITNSQSLCKLMSIESVIPSNHSHALSPLFLPAFNLSKHQGLFKWVSSSIQVTKVLELQLQHPSFQWIFRTDFLYDGLVGSPCSPRDSQESSPTPQFKGINSSVISLLYGPTLTTI